MSVLEGWSGTTNGIPLPSSTDIHAAASFVLLLYPRVVCIRVAEVRSFCDPVPALNQLVQSGPCYPRQVKDQDWTQDWAVVFTEK